MLTKNEFLVLYDYETGGVWALAVAENKGELERRLPQLTIVETPPKWMDANELEAIRRGSRFFVSDSRTYPNWLKSLLADKS